MAKLNGDLYLEPEGVTAAEQKVSELLDHPERDPDDDWFDFSWKEDTYSLNIWMDEEGITRATLFLDRKDPQTGYLVTDVNIWADIEVRHECN